MAHDNSSEPKADDSRELARQLETELAILLKIEQSLQLVLQWMTRNRGNGHKLSTLRFTARSFERHLTRMRVLADHSGYMQAITDGNPHLATAVIELKDRRRDLQVAFERIILRLEFVSPNDEAVFEDVCTELTRYLEKLEKHGQKEMELLQHSFAQEQGGEG